VTTDSDLRDRLTRIAERTAPPEDPHLAIRVTARSRARRRQRIGLTALAAGVAAVVVAVPAALSGPSVVPAPAAPAVPAPGSTVDVLAGPTRGPLAADSAFLEGVRRLSWQLPDQGPNTPDPDVSTRRVVWAGDVAGARWALVAGENTARPEGAAADPERQTDLGALGDVAVVWFTGPSGADPDRLSPATLPRGVVPGLPVALADATTGAMVVVSAPGDVVEVSRRPEVAADATVSRTWEPAGTTDGVAVLALPADGTATLPALAYRVVRDGVPVTASGPDGTGHGVLPPVPVTWLRGVPEPSTATLGTPRTARDVLSTVGLRADEVEAAVVWSGRVPSPDDRAAEVVLLAVTLPSGAAYVQADVTLSGPDGSGAGTWCGTDLRPAGTPLTGQTFVLRCQLPTTAGRTPAGESLVVVAPPTAAATRLLDGDGEVLGSLLLRDGVVVAEDVDGLAAVQVLAGDGTVLAEAAPMGTVDWAG
jgi:hypothetical protein